MPVYPCHWYLQSVGTLVWLQTLKTPTTVQISDLLFCSIPLLSQETLMDGGSRDDFGRWSIKLHLRIPRRRPSQAI